MSVNLCAPLIKVNWGTPVALPGVILGSRAGWPLGKFAWPCPVRSTISDTYQIRAGWMSSTHPKQHRWVNASEAVARRPSHRSNIRGELCMNTTIVDEMASFIQPTPISPCVLYWFHSIKIHAGSCLSYRIRIFPHPAPRNSAARTPRQTPTSEANQEDGQVTHGSQATRSARYRPTTSEPRTNRGVSRFIPPHPVSCNESHTRNTERAHNVYGWWATVCKG